MAKKNKENAIKRYGAYAGKIGDSEIGIASSSVYVTDCKNHKVREYPTEEEAVQDIREKEMC